MKTITIFEINSQDYFRKPLKIIIENGFFDIITGLAWDSNVAATHHTYRKV